MRTIIILVVVEIFGFVIFASDPCQNCEEISKKVENFSNDIQNEMAKTHRGNFATAPFNLFSILTMVTYAVFGRSNTQLKKALRYDDYKCLRRALISIVEKLHNESSGSMVMSAQIFVGKNYRIKWEFKKITNPVFQFSENFTDDKSIIFKNTAHFNGKWRTSFSKFATSPQKFYSRMEIKGHTAPYVDMMHGIIGVKYGILEKWNARFIELPFAEENLSMVVILPLTSSTIISKTTLAIFSSSKNVSALEHLMKNLNESTISSFLNTAEIANVDILLPKIVINSEINWKESLNHLGVSDMFQLNSNFSGMTDGLVENVKVLENVSISLSEEGLNQPEDHTTAANVEFKADIPFFFAIIKRFTPENLLVLFNGHYTNPP